MCDAVSLQGMIPTPVELVRTRTPNTLPSTAPASEAARRLRDPDVPAVVVLDGDEYVAGVVTDSDIVALVAETRADPPLSTLMSSPVATVTPTTSVRDAAAMMCEHGVRTLPVVDGDVYCGVVTREALAPHVSRHRLDVAWTGEPLSVDGTDVPEVSAAE